MVDLGPVLAVLGYASHQMRLLPFEGMVLLGGVLYIILFEAGKKIWLRLLSSPSQHCKGWFASEDFEAFLEIHIRKRVV